MLKGICNIMKQRSVPSLAYSVLGLSLLLSSGCAAFRPIPGVPARYLSPELRAESRADESTIDLSLLAQTPPRNHYVDGGDVLGIYIEGVLGNPGEAPPITVPVSPELPPAIGYPITVRDDGTLSLPMIGSVDVRGLTIRQVEEKLRHIYTIDKKILQPGQDRIIVSLQRPRQVRVLVLRQETGGPAGTEFAQGLSINLGQTKRGNGQAVDLPIYKNDVLHALAKTGGLPGLDAENTIYIIRRQQGPQQACLPGQMPHGQVLPGQPVPQHYPQQHYPQPQYPQPQPGPQPPVQQYAPPQHPHPPAQQPQVSQRNAGHRIQRGAYERTRSTKNDVVIRGQSPSGYAPQNMTRYSSPSGQMPVRQASAIEHVEARGFGSRNPLDELRGGSSRQSMPAVRDVPVSNVSAERELFGHSAYNQPQLTAPQTPDYSPEPELTPTPEPMFRNQPAPQNYSQTQPPQQNLQSQPYGQPQMYGQPPIQNYSGQNYPAQEYEEQGYSSQTPMLPPQPAPAQPYHVGTHRLPPELQGMLAGEADWMPAGQDPWFNGNDPTMNNPHVIKIPVRLKPGQQPHIQPSDVILQDGDIIFIESRETEIFYTGGLLGGGQYTLPRDYDLDVLGAIAIAQGASQQQATRQIGGVSAINGDVTISASNVIILRMLPNGTQVPIKIDLYRAIRDPAERVIIQPGDIVMLRYKPMEAVGAFIERNLLESALFGLAASSIPSSN